ncbi:hypothetical protein QOT17_024335 [Balamuthia mandrillaris]
MNQKKKQTHKLHHINSGLWCKKGVGDPVVWQAIISKHKVTLIGPNNSLLQTCLYHNHWFLMFCNGEAKEKRCHNHMGKEGNAACLQNIFTYL